MKVQSFLLLPKRGTKAQMRKAMVIQSDPPGISLLSGFHTHPPYTRVMRVDYTKVNTHTDKGGDTHTFCSDISENPHISPNKHHDMNTTGLLVFPF